MPMAQPTFCPVQAKFVTCPCQQSSHMPSLAFGTGPFLRTELARAGYSIQAISSNYSSTIVVTGAAFSPSSLPLLPFPREAAPVLSLPWEVAALVGVLALAVSAFAVFGCSAGKRCSCSDFI